MKKKKNTRIRKSRRKYQWIFNNRWGDQAKVGFLSNY